MDVFELNGFRLLLKKDRSLLIKLFSATVWGALVFIGWAYVFGWCLQIIRWVSSGYTHRGLPDLEAFDQKTMLKYFRQGLLWQIMFLIYWLPALAVAIGLGSALGVQDIGSPTFPVPVIFLVAYFFTGGALLIVATLRYAATDSILSFFDIFTNYEIVIRNLWQVEWALLKVALGIAGGIAVAFGIVWTFIGPLVMIPVTIMFVAYTTGRLGASINLIGRIGLPGYVANDTYE